MRKAEKEQILSLLDTIIEALGYVEAQRGSEGLVKQLLNDSRYAFLEISMKLDCSDHQQKELSIELETWIKQIEKRQKKEPAIFDLEQLGQLRDKMQQTIQPKLCVVFLPYKYSMWDSMESIWECARKDAYCDCHLLPIPYFDRNREGKMIQFYYEKNLFPEEAEDYSACPLEKLQPDIIYFHNPYDDRNFVTTIHPQFYSSRLKESCGMLVYVPYYVAGDSTTHDGMKTICQLPGCASADKIILQSQTLKESYLYHKIPEEKLEVLGSPKIDAVLQREHKKVYSPEWKEKLTGRKVVLINTSLAGLLGMNQYMDTIQDMILQLTKQAGVGFIWRPHPLLVSTIKSMRPQEAEKYNGIIDIISESENGCFDNHPDIYPSIEVSDGLISDYSSLLMQYTFTGKPALSLTVRSRMEDQIVYCDYYGNYFTRDGVTIQDFVEILLSGRDEKKKERLEHAKKSIAYSDGSSGRRIYEFIKEDYLKH